MGNSLNAADFSNSDNNDYIGPIQGQINIYLSQDDPAQLSPDTLKTYSQLLCDYASKTPIAPVLEKIARRYSPVRCKLFGSGSGFVLNLFIIDHNDRILVREQGHWNIKGHFKVALEDNEDLEWFLENGQYCAIS